MPAMWPWVLRLGGSTDLGTRGRLAPGHTYACSPAPQARGLSLLRCLSSRAGSVGMRVGFAGLDRIGRPVCANLAWAGYVVTAAGVRTELDSMVARLGWGGTPAETAAEAEVLITVLPGSQELHDVMIIPHSARGTTLSGVVIS